MLNRLTFSLCQVLEQRSWI